MVHKAKKREFRFTFKVFIRVVVFSIIIYLIISYLSAKKIKNTIDTSNITVLGEESTESAKPNIVSNYLNSAYNLIPEKNRQQLENINQTPAYIFVQDKIEYLKQQTSDFPNKQIKEIQKAIVKSVYDNAMKNIESKP